MILAHYSGSDVGSAMLVFGVALIFSGWRGVTRGERRRGMRLGGLGVAALAIGVAAGFAHS